MTQSGRQPEHHPTLIKREAEQIEGAALGAGGGGEDGGEAIALETNDIAGERGEIAKQGVEAVQRERFPPLSQGQARPGRCVCGRPCAAPPVRARPWPPVRCVALRGRPDRARRTAWGEAPTHVPLQIIGQHAEQDVRAHPRCGPVEHRTQLELTTLILKLISEIYRKAGITFGHIA
jgi:hypothetical protein